MSDWLLERLIHDEGDGTFVVWPYGSLGRGYRVSARRKDHFLRAKKVAIWVWIILPATAAIAFDLNFWQFAAVCVSVYLIERTWFRWFFRDAEATTKLFRRQSFLDELRAVPLALQYAGFLISVSGLIVPAMLLMGGGLTRSHERFLLLMLLAGGVSTAILGYLVVTNEEPGDR